LDVQVPGSEAFKKRVPETSEGVTGCPDPNRGPNRGGGGGVREEGESRGPRVGVEATGAFTPPADSANATILGSRRINNIGATNRLSSQAAAAITALEAIKNTRFEDLNASG